jgi:hypothetical protein
MTEKDYLQIEDQSEEKLDNVREPALKVAQRRCCRGGSTPTFKYSGEKNESRS